MQLLKNTDNTQNFPWTPANFPDFPRLSG